jgi:O-antigen/teichoic acid export membrane protein
MNRQEIIEKSLRGGAVVFTAMLFQYSIVFLTQIILARILTPSQFGAFAFVTMVTMIFNCFTNIHGDKYIVKERMG